MFLRCGTCCLNVGEYIHPTFWSRPRNVPIRLATWKLGSSWKSQPLMFATFLYVFCLLSLGLLISTRAANQIQALQMTMIFLLPSVFFSGFIFPRETMPWIFYAIGSALPATYYIELERAIILRGANFFEYWHNLLVLILMSNLLFILCALRFRRKIA